MRDYPDRRSLASGQSNCVEQSSSTNRRRTGPGGTGRQHLSRSSAHIMPDGGQGADQPSLTAGFVAQGRGQQQTRGRPQGLPARQQPPSSQAEPMDKQRQTQANVPQQQRAQPPVGQSEQAVGSAPQRGGQEQIRQGELETSSLARAQEHPPERNQSPSDSHPAGHR